MCRAAWPRSRAKLTWSSTRARPPGWPNPRARWRSTTTSRSAKRRRKKPPEIWRPAAAGLRSAGARHAVRALPARRRYGTGDKPPAAVRNRGSFNENPDRDQFAGLRNCDAEDAVLGILAGFQRQFGALTGLNIGVVEFRSDAAHCAQKHQAAQIGGGIGERNLRRFSHRQRDIAPVRLDLIEHFRRDRAWYARGIPHSELARAGHSG